MTSKDYLSQEEIDALLRQSAGESETAQNGGGNSGDFSPEDYVDTMEKDALGEIGNITFGSAATALSTLLGKKVDITTPEVSVIHREELEREFPKPHVAVHVSYVDGFQGINSLVIRTRDAQVIADLMLGGEGMVDENQELNEIHVSAVQEAMNQMMGSSATSMSTIFNRLVNISPPAINILDVHNGEGVNSLPPVDVFIKIAFNLKIGDLIDSTIMQLLPVSFAKDMVATLMGGVAEEPPAQSAAPPVSEAPAAAAPPAAPPAPEPAAAASMGQTPMAEARPVQDGEAQGPNTYGGTPGRNINVQPVQFANFQGAPYVQADDTNLNLLLDIPLRVTVELGRTQKQIKEILELSQGSIIELDKLAGEPVDILVNNKLIAKGEVVVIDENFGVRVTDIVSQWDRIQKLQ
ncbi:flagellar motor switch phosphatase FliY [Paenibacillus sp. IB182496]|uniref:Flagellar motor switch phosphatase FliY n=1 Tax=Paenibacillus sabuli TaxID=2772509 RepID=A0A927BR84_9BACL|nr:flagellar motor switch phosphatase FliY [Paenibacillus sabuli]MBD2845278.1 flagellar motor switch phosphatase FliY [Paenibacillus sabuli]